MDYNNKVNLEDKNTDFKNKMLQLNNEKNLIIKQLEQHKQCIKEKEEYNGAKYP